MIINSYCCHKTEHTVICEVFFPDKKGRGEEGKETSLSDQQFSEDTGVSITGNLISKI